jgi:hypothetical protein
MPTAIDSTQLAAAFSGRLLKPTDAGYDEARCVHNGHGFNVAIISQWSDGKDTAECIAWCRDTHTALEPYLAPMRYVNYLDNDEAGDPAADAYGVNYARLRELKTKYDRDNFFHTNVNIKPLEIAGPW